MECDEIGFETRILICFIKYNDLNQNFSKFFVNYFNLFLSIYIFKSLLKTMKIKLLTSEIKQMLAFFSD